MEDAKRLFIAKAERSAAQAQCPFPLMVACEAALESGYGKSLLAITYNNLLGMKAHRHQIYGTASLPTREFERGVWIETVANWVNYPDWASCFADRMATLNRLASVYPHYAAALDARDPETYIREVSQTWSTDPARADKCLTIYQEYLGASPQPVDIDGEISV